MEDRDRAAEGETRGGDEERGRRGGPNSGEFGYMDSILPVSPSLSLPHFVGQVRNLSYGPTPGAKMK